MDIETFTFMMIIICITYLCRWALSNDDSEENK